MNFHRYAERAVGAVRIAMGFCPKCNSDAPELNSCSVCQSYRSSDFGNEFPPSKIRKEEWWNRFMEETKA